jgi:hypothetical protein
MNESTALPALTNIITRLGFFNFETMSFKDCAPMILVPENTCNLFYIPHTLLEISI